jgi:hypothetical protein
MMLLNLVDVWWVGEYGDSRWGRGREVFHE